MTRASAGSRRPRDKRRIHGAKVDGTGRSKPQLIYNYLRGRWGQYVSGAKLARVASSDCVSTHISTIRRQLAARGSTITVVCERRGIGKNFYRLELVMKR